MVATPTYPRSRRRWNVVAVVLVGLYVLSLAAFAAGSIDRGFVSSIGFGAYGNPRAFGPIAAQIALGVAAFYAYYRPRRREARNFSVPVTGVLAGTTIAVGMIAYWNCPSTSTESPFWTPLTFALNLIVGNVQDCQVDVPAQTYPPAIQLVRLFGPLLLVIAALGIVTSVFRAQSDRWRLRFSRSAVVMVGLTDDAMPLLRRLSTDRESDTTLAVLVADAGNPLVKAARDLDARVVVCDADDAAALTSLLTSRRTFKVRAFYAVSADVTVNLRWAAQLRAVADSTKPTRADMAPRLVVRIDDPWQAEYWRRTNAYRTSGSGRSVRWMSDALSVYEVTAALLLDRIMEPQGGPAFDQLIVVGNSALALAVCAELAQREREAQALGQPTGLDFHDVLLFGPDADTLSEQHRLRQERFGNSGGSRMAVELAEPTSENLRRAVRARKNPALILADDPAVSNPQLATYLAALNPTWSIFDWSPAARGVADEPIMERLYPFGLTTEAPSFLPVDSWERAARVVHEQYRTVMRQNSLLDTDQPSHRAWERLDPFLKETNVRQVTTALAAAEAVGRSWGPVVEGVTADGRVTSAEVTPDELDQMAQMEHASWMKHLQDNHWRYGPMRDKRRRTHPSLLPWPELPESDREKTRDGVTSALTTLTSLGYRSTVLRAQPAAGSGNAYEGSEWVPVRRRGEITAVRPGVEWTWVNDADQTMRAGAGDWRITNSDGKSWSVAPDIFAATYEHLGGDRWRRTGQAKARPAVAGESVESLEGRQTAKAGDWVIEGPKGEQWVTSAAHFAANYERLQLDRDPRA